MDRYSSLRAGSLRCCGGLRHRPAFRRNLLNGGALPQCFQCIGVQQAVQIHNKISLRHGLAEHQLTGRQGQCGIPVVVCPAGRTDLEGKCFPGKPGIPVTGQGLADRNADTSRIGAKTGTVDIGKGNRGGIGTHGAGIGAAAGVKAADVRRVGSGSFQGKAFRHGGFPDSKPGILHIRDGQGLAGLQREGGTARAVKAQLFRCRHSRSAAGRRDRLSGFGRHRNGKVKTAVGRESQPCIRCAIFRDAQAGRGCQCQSSVVALIGIEPALGQAARLVGGIKTGLGSLRQVARPFRADQIRQIAKPRGIGHDIPSAAVAGHIILKVGTPPPDDIDAGGDSIPRACIVIVLKIVIPVRVKLGLIRPDGTGRVEIQRCVFLDKIEGIGGGGIEFHRGVTHRFPVFLVAGI